MRSLRIQVCHAMPERQDIVELRVDAGCTIGAAIVASGLPERLGLDMARHRVGIFGKLRALSHGVQDGDRIEIYRALTVDPKTARHRRVATARLKKVR